MYFNACSLEQGLYDYLSSIASQFSIQVFSKTAKGLFRDLIDLLSKETPIVVIIDEYEMSITGFVAQR